jgi:hypothetical protein
MAESAHLALPPHAIVLQLSGEVPSPLAALSLLCRPEALRTHICIRTAGLRACFTSEREVIVYGRAIAHGEYLHSRGELRCEGEAAAKLFVGTQQNESVLVDVFCTNEEMLQFPSNMAMHANHLMLSLATMLDERGEMILPGNIVIAPESRTPPQLVVAPLGNVIGPANDLIKRTPSASVDVRDDLIRGLWFDLGAQLRREMTE